MQRDIVKDRTFLARKSAPATADDTAVFHMQHFRHPRTMRPSSIRTMRSASCAISSLWVIITMV